MKREPVPKMYTTLVHTNKKKSMGICFKEQHQGAQIIS